MEALSLKGGPEALHGSVIVTASLSAHAGADLVGVQELTEGTRPKISAFPVRRSELQAGSGKFLKNGVISVGSARFW